MQLQCLLELVKPLVDVLEQKVVDELAGLDFRGCLQQFDTALHLVLGLLAVVLELSELLLQLQLQF